MRQSEYKHIADLLTMIEEDAFYSLRVPHQVRDRKESLEFFIAFQAGRLAVVDDIRLMGVQALAELEKMQQAQNEEYAKRG